MSYDMMNSPSSVSPMRPDYDLPANAAVPYSYKSAYAFPGRGPHSSLTIAEQAELEYELRYRGNMIVDQQRKIQQLEEELRQARDQVDMMNTQLNNYEQDRAKEKKKPQSRYWTPEEHQRFLEALQKYGHKDVKSISMHVSTRNATQVRTHAQKYFLRLERERRKKDENSGHVDGYDSSGSLDDGSPSEGHDDMISSVPISSLTLPGSPAVNMIGEIGTPPGTPGDSTPGTPGTPSAPSSPIPRRRRATSFITVAQARLAAQHRDSVLVGLPPTWTIEDYELFMKGLLTLADKQDDVSTLCRMIREQYLPHHTPDEVELCYRNVLKNIKQKPIVGSPKRRRTNSRPEPLTSPLGVSSSFAPSFPVPPVSTLSSSFPFRNSMNSPTNNNVVSSMPFGSSPPTNTSPLSHNQSANLSSMRNTPPFSDYGQLSTGLEFPMMSELNLNGVSPMSNANTNSPPNNSTSSSPVTSSPQQQHHHHQQQQQQPQQQQQNMQNGLPINQSSLSPHLNSNAPITPSSLWGSALPFSFDALMSGNVALPQAIPLVSHN